MKLISIIFLALEFFSGCKNAGRTRTSSASEMENHMVAPGKDVKLEDLPKDTILTIKLQKERVQVEQFFVPGGRESAFLFPQGANGLDSPFSCEIVLKNKQLNDLPVARLKVVQVDFKETNSKVGGGHHISGAYSPPLDVKVLTHTFTVTEDTSNVKSVICSRERRKMTMSNLACIFDIKIPGQNWASDKPLVCDPK